MTGKNDVRAFYIGPYRSCTRPWHRWLQLHKPRLVKWL